MEMQRLEGYLGGQIDRAWSGSGIWGYAFGFGNVTKLIIH